MSVFVDIGYRVDGGRVRVSIRHRRGYWRATVRGRTGVTEAQHSDPIEAVRNALDHAVRWDIPGVFRVQE